MAAGDVSWRHYKPFTEEQIDTFLKEPEGATLAGYIKGYVELVTMVREKNATSRILCLAPDSHTTSAEISRKDQARVAHLVQAGVKKALQQYAETYPDDTNVQYRILRPCKVSAPDKHSDEFVQLCKTVSSGDIDEQTKKAIDQAVEEVALRIEDPESTDVHKAEQDWAQLGADMPFTAVPVQLPSLTVCCGCDLFLWQGTGEQRGGTTKWPLL